jgi:hypothetical protein
MDLIKQYIIQSISAASNNLRLSTQKIEVVALLRETIAKSEDLEADIKKMKKITELSTLAIRLNEIYNSLTQSVVDFFKISDKFKTHSQYLIKDLSHMLDLLDPNSFKKALAKLNPAEEAASNSGSKEDISLDLSKRKVSEDVFVKSESDTLKENFIMEEEREDDESAFQNFEETILKPVKPIDAMLKNLSEDKFNTEELIKFAKVMMNNAEISSRAGFDIIANMHRIIGKSLQLISSRDLMPGREIVESIRACLIVIVAVVKGKEVDITNYLNRAEEFGRKIKP